MSGIQEPESVTETRLTHEVHRCATSLLADAAGRSSTDIHALGELRDFVVATLRHHHESEDGHLWPLITAIAPGVSAGLGDLSTEHEELDAALDALAVAPVSPPGDRAGLINAAVSVRDLVRRHLAHEEPLLLPALQSHVSDQAWAEFRRLVIETSPPTGAYLMFGFFDRVGTQEEIELMISGLPTPMQELLPTMRTQAKTTLDKLHAPA
jgi:hemerythrin-like domain-containing protein